MLERFCLVDDPRGPSESNVQRPLRCGQTWIEDRHRKGVICSRLGVKLKERIGNFSYRFLILPWRSYLVCELPLRCAELPEILLCVTQTDNICATRIVVILELD